MRLFLFAACGVALICAKPRADEHQDIVFSGAKKPVVIRLHILIDGKPFRQVYQQAWDEYLKALFHQLDKDGDGFLSEAEGQRLPPPAQQVGGAASRPTNMAFNFRVVDANGDGKIDFAEAAAYYRTYGGAGIALTTAPPIASIPPAVNDKLFHLLDTDGDGRLSREELAAATKLMALDADGDELLTAPEIFPRLFALDGNQPRRPVPPGVRAAGRAATGPFKLLDSAEGEPEIELQVRLGTRAPGEKTLEVLKVNDKSIEVRPTPTGFAVRLGESNTAIEVHVNDSRPALAPNFRQQLLDQFHAADIGSKGHLTLRDAQMRGFYPQQFPLLDRDMDGKLTEPELIDYLDQVHGRQARAVTSIVSILTSNEAMGLFDLLDCNHDGRLGLWELRSAPRLMELAGGKEYLTREELPRTYHLAVGLCQASFNRWGGHGVFTPRGLPMLALDWSLPGLAWFHKMDRNRDGFVSLREFLGPVEAFRRLDRDGDGLISPEEAQRAK
jgi:Ca2+-binding EF-hand superfamily protein